MEQRGGFSARCETFPKDAGGTDYQRAQSLSVRLMSVGRSRCIDSGLAEIVAIRGGAALQLGKGRAMSKCCVD